MDVDAVGLGDFARRDAYIARQLKRWHGQFTQSTVDGEPGPAIVDRVHELLAAKIPEQQGVSIVHGDYRLDNTVLDDAGTVQAILDWEICTLGDPLADLGLLLVYWAEPGDGDQALIGVPDSPSDRTCSPATPARRDWTSRRSPTTGRSDSGSWPVSSRGSMCAMPEAPAPATGPASSSSPPTSVDWVTGPWPRWSRCDRSRSVVAL